MSQPNQPLTDRNLILGVDPGALGAMALYCLDTKKLIEVRGFANRIITKKNGSKSRRINLEEVALFLDMNRDLIRAALIEEVGSRPGEGSVSSFSFGFNTGVIHGLVASHLIPITTVLPTIWKMNMGLTSNKKVSLDKAKALFPEHINQFLKIKDEGKAEAALLAKYGERIFGIKKEHRI